MDPNTLAGLILSKWVDEQIFGKKKDPKAVVVWVVGV